MQTRNRTCSLITPLIEYTNIYALMSMDQETQTNAHTQVASSAYHGTKLKGSQAKSRGLQTGKSSSKVGGILRIGFLSKKFTGLRSKLDDTVGMIG